MWRELLVALVLAASNVVIHALGTYALLLWLIRLTQKQQSFSVSRRAVWTTLVLVTALLILHSIEVAVWGQFFLWQHCFPDRETAYYYSLKSYTTVGYGDVLLASPWRLMGGLEAMVGVLMFGWSTACLVALVYRIQDALVKKHLGEVPN